MLRKCTRLLNFKYFSSSLTFFKRFFWPLHLQLTTQNAITQIKSNSTVEITAKLIFSQRRGGLFPLLLNILQYFRDIPEYSSIFPNSSQYSRVFPSIPQYSRIFFIFLSYFRLIPENLYTYCRSETPLGYCSNF